MSQVRERKAKGTRKKEKAAEGPAGALIGRIRLGWIYQVLSARLFMYIVLYFCGLGTL